MGSFSPEMLPVFSTLAKNFAVYDAWHAGVPSQTFCNRSFFHASTSHGFVTNKDGGGYDKWIDAPATPTVFNRLEEAGLSWRVYYDVLQMVSFTGMLHAPVLEPYWRVDFRSMEQFHDDVKNGNLPGVRVHRAAHDLQPQRHAPAVGTLREGEYDGHKVYNSALSDVRAGELLMHQVYVVAQGRVDQGLERAQHGVPRDLRRARRNLRPRATAHRDAAATQRRAPGRDGLHLRPAGMPRAGHLVSALHAAGSIIHDEMHHGRSSPRSTGCTASRR